jgi:ABC-2 type transport system ATP-binding protein
MPTTSAIVTESLTRTYGSRRGIDAVSLNVPEGSLYGFLGPNGAGKTTTIRVLLGFLRPSAGQASVFGLDCWRHSARIKQEVGYVPGDLRLWGWMHGHAALSLIGRIRRRDLRAEGKRLAELFDLDLHVKVRRMSRGMRQKLGLVLAMAHRPRLLVLDEPTSALDPLMQDRFRELLRELSAGGTTVFFSSHTLGEVEALCERVAIVRAGRIVADSTLESLRKQARHEVDIVWSPGKNAETPGNGRSWPQSLQLTRRDATRWTGTVGESDISALVNSLAGLPIADLRIARPDLETIFRRYYEIDDAIASRDEQSGGDAQP